MISLLGTEGKLAFGVFDGHGDAGRQVSRRVAHSVLSTLAERANEENVGAVLDAALPEADKALPSRVGLASGTTAIIAVLLPSPAPRIVVACVGDSRCVLGLANPEEKKRRSSKLFGSANAAPTWHATALSIDQKPDVRNRHDCHARHTARVVTRIIHIHIHHRESGARLYATRSRRHAPRPLHPCRLSRRRLHSRRS
jgi:hypothetical protein